MLDKITIKQLLSVLTVIGMIVTGGGWTFALWAAEQKFVTHESMNEYFQEQRVQTLDDKIFEIELIPEVERSQRQKAILEKHKREHTKLLKEINK